MAELNPNDVERSFEQNNPISIGSYNRISDIPVIYHYTNADALKSIISNKRFWMSNCHFLNDSEEIHYTVDIVKRIYEKRVPKLNTKQLINEFIQTAQNIVNLFVLSTSYNKDNLTLWYNYAKNDGYSIGLEFKTLLEMIENSNENKFGILTYRPTSQPESTMGKVLFDKVNYDIKEQELIVSSIFDYFEELVSKTSNPEEIRVYRIRSIHSLLICSVFFKNNCFSSEAEFRIVLNVHNGLNEITHFRTSNGGIVPYIEVGIKIGTNTTLPIKEIYIGPQNKSDIAEKGLKVFLNQLDYGGVEIQKTQIPLRF